MPRIEVFSEKCCGCRICEMACSMERLGLFCPSKALLRVEIDRFPGLETGTSDVDKPRVCIQCDPAPCAEACPAEAITKDGQGVLKVVRERCTGCGSCVDACPENLMLMNSESETAEKCDLCGGDPLCVRYCPTGSLTIAK